MFRFCDSTKLAQVNGSTPTSPGSAISASPPCLLMSKPHSPITSPPILPSNRRTHRKRISALRLSSDTTSTLPEYIPTGGWSQTTTTTTTTTTTSGTGRPGVQALAPAHFGIHNQGVETPLDLPPDYPDSAEEADEDTDSESAFEGSNHGRHRSHRQQQEEYVPQFTVYGGHHHNSIGTSSTTTSPRRVRRFPSHKSGRSFVTTSSGPKSPSQNPTQPSARSSPLPSPSTSDLFLDSLLERSVHALEMSNALLQSSITTRSTLTNLISAGEGSGSSEPPEPPPKMAQRPRSRSSSGVVSDERYDALESRIKTWKNVQETWVDDLDEIKRGVERLFTGRESGESVDDTEVEVGRDSQSRRRREHGGARGHRSEGSSSSSLPTESPLQQRVFPYNHRHQRNLSSISVTYRSASPEPLDADDGFMPQLRFEAQGRERLIAQPPRALTQYVVANGDTDTILLPSTLGVRSASSSHTGMLTIIAGPAVLLTLP